MEELSIYDCKFVYVKGTDNSAADALSRLPNIIVNNTTDAENAAIQPFPLPTNFKPSILDHISPSVSPLSTISALVDTHFPENTTSSVSFDPDFITKICDAYTTDPWCQKLRSASKECLNLRLEMASGF